jgi:hypothetical protein
MPDVPTTDEIEGARSSDTHPGTFDESSYKLLRRFLSHDDIISAAQPTERTHGVALPIEYIQTGIANNAGSYRLAIPEAEAMLDRDLIQARTNRNAFMASRNSPIASALSTNLISQEEHDGIVDALSSHHGALGARENDIDSTADILGEITGLGASPSLNDQMIDQATKLNSKDYPGAHSWMQSELGKLKSDGVITVGRNFQQEALNLTSENELFKHINQAIHNGHQLGITYRGYKDLDAKSRTIVPTMAWFNPKNNGLYVRAYDPDVLDDDGNVSGGWRTFRGSNMFGASQSTRSELQLPEDPDMPELTATINDLHSLGALTSLTSPEIKRAESTGCSCGTSSGLHSVKCYQDMASKLVKHYNAQMVSSCVSPVAGESPDTISPETLASFIATRRKLEIARNAGDSVFFPNAYVPARHGL